MRKIVDNDTFVRKNLEKLVKRYAHKCVVICNGEVFTGDDAFEKTKKKYPSSIPMVLPVPGPENFNHIL
jgi:hypothetical protein